MCCTLEPARLSKTRIYAAEVMRNDGLAHVIGYQNAVAGMPGPNAMLLPFPAEGRVSRDNLVNGEKFKSILGAYDDAVEALRPRRLSRARSFSKGVLLGSYDDSDYEVFESGSYTIALAQKADALIPAVLEVPEARRPVVHPKFVEALGKLYPEWPIALCCFEGTMEGPEPLFWWFRPRFPEVLFAPAIDAHDGEPPKLDAHVRRDHMLAFASYASRRPINTTLQGEIERQVPPEHRWLFDPRVCGRKFDGVTHNGDFVYDLDTVRDEKVEGWLPVKVTAPPQDRPDKWAHLMAESVV